jgi:hypothetical protein
MKYLLKPIIHLELLTIVLWLCISFIYNIFQVSVPIVTLFISMGSVILAILASELIFNKK